jgi:DNA-directed RNA polymerase specialized sigma24 family protein
VVVRFPVPNTDFGLFDALRAGHPNAKRVLCDRHSGELLRVATRIFGPNRCATTLVTETLQYCIENLNTLTEPRALRVWLLMRLIGAARRKLRFRRFLRWFAGEPESTNPRELPFSEQLIATYQLLDQLGVEQRLAFCLVILQSMRLPEAATLLGTSVAVLEPRLLRTHTRFAKLAQLQFPTLMQQHRSHAALGTQIADEQDGRPSDMQLYESDLVAVFTGFHKT